ncbi:AGAP007289-PB [Anopheles gambiae str. PEST]|uniref:AGAP007289-PB n=1 Tax=Anopheles gambiae TaxID=7165 RepID=Q706F3_ANOGA|nr:AGAP007289-PB [Anopheles gambiae str. PEST]CAF01996.1 putative odorant-binding protein OBPjj1 [Anopheles gambiae]
MNPIVGKVFLVLCGSLLVTGAPNTCGKLDLKTDPFTCCTIPKLLDVTIVSSCFEKFPIDKDAADKGAASMPKTECMSECILNSTGIYNRRGDVDEKKLNSVFTDSLPANSPWLNVVRKAIKECTAKADKKDKEFQKDVADQKKATPKGTQVCNPEASFLVDCIHTTVFSDCPTNLRSTSTECDAIWNFLKNCPFSALRQ